MESAGKIRYTVKGVLQCEYCHNTLKGARFLNCHHSFCGSCLGDLTSQEDERYPEITCPKCFHVTQLLNKNIEDLVSDDRANALTEELFSSDDHSNTCTPCRVCEPGRSKNIQIRAYASVYCNQCKYYLCKSCVHVHDRLPMFPSHKVVNLLHTTASNDLHSSLEDSTRVADDNANSKSDNKSHALSCEKADGPRETDLLTGEPKQKLCRCCVIS